MNTFGHVQYYVNVVSINNLERREHQTIKDFVRLTYFNTKNVYIRINSTVIAILMTSLFTPEADLRCVNWIESLQMPQSLI